MRFAEVGTKFGTKVAVVLAESKVVASPPETPVGDSSASSLPSLNAVSFSVERPILSPDADRFSGATRLSEAGRRT